MTEGNFCCKRCKEMILAVAPVSINNSTCWECSTAHNLGKPVHEQYPEIDFIGGLLSTGCP